MWSLHFVAEEYKPDTAGGMKAVAQGARCARKHVVAPDTRMRKNQALTPHSL